MIIGIVLPDAITPAQVETLLGWVRTKAEKMRPWVQTYVMAEAAKEGVEVDDSTILVVFDAVITALSNLIAWPSMSDETISGARDWYVDNANG